MATLDDYVIDVLLRDLVGHDRRPVSFLVYLWLAAEREVSALYTAQFVVAKKGPNP